MTVKELKKVLADMPEDATVYIPSTLAGSKYDFYHIKVCIEDIDGDIVIA